MGHTKACYNLSYTDLKNEDGVEKDPLKAASLYKKNLVI